MDVPVNVTMVTPANGNKLSTIKETDVKHGSDMKDVGFESVTSTARTNALGTKVYRPKRK